MDNSISLVVKVRVKEEFIEEAYTFMKALHKLTHEFDKGCIQYDLHKIVDKKDTFMFIEKWEDKDALDAHAKAEHHVNFAEYMKDKVEEVDMNILENEKVLDE